ncbi:MAG: prevent-host-death protein [Bryobacteraceae bacterium]
MSKNTAEPVTVSVGEFRENLAAYLLQSTAPVAITSCGRTLGYFLPARRRRSEAERAALQEAVARMQQTLDAMGITEDEVVADFKRWRAGKRR